MHGWLPFSWIEVLAAAEALMWLCLFLARMFFVGALIIYGANLALYWVTRVGLRRMAPADRTSSLRLTPHPSHSHPVLFDQDARYLRPLRSVGGFKR